MAERKQRTLSGLRLRTRARAQAHEDAIYVICCVKNERDILPAFLNHYRRLGARRFIFIDNASGDGSGSYLESQDDAIVYWTDDSYADAVGGLSWINEVASQHCIGKWVLTVDADEFLILPPSMPSSLRHLVGCLETELSLGVFCALVDTVSQELSKPTREFRTIDDLLATCTRMESFESVRMTASAEFPYADLRGRLRSKLAKHKNYAPPLGKVPLVLWREGFRYTRSTHSGGLVPLSPHAAVLLHFKMRPGLKARLDEEGPYPDRMNHIGSQIMRKILRNIATMSDTDWDTCTVPVDLPGLESSRWFNPIGGDTQDAFDSRWIQMNASRRAWLKNLVAYKHEELLELDHALRRLAEETMDDPSWKLSRPLRTRLHKLGLISHLHVPEHKLQNLDALQAIRAVLTSNWWVFAGLGRMVTRLSRRAVNYIQRVTGRDR